MDRLLEEDELYLTPLSGNYDMDRVAEAIMPIDYAIRDEFLPSTYLLFLTETDRDAFMAERRADPNSSLPYVLIIDVTPKQVVIHRFAPSEHDVQTRRFLAWMADNYPHSSLYNEAGADFNEEWAAVVESPAGR